MKKRILIIFISLLVIIGIALFSFRHVIIGHALQITISKKTDKTISLDIGDVYYDIFNSSVSFSNSELLFNNTYLNQEKTIELSQLKFDKIEIDNLSILKLIFKREVIAKKLIITKPSLWFMENHNPTPFKEKSKAILKSLKQHHDILKNLTIIVDEVEITHGMVDLKSLIAKKEQNGSVEFKLLLKKINTSIKQDFNKTKILFAEEHFVKLSNFNYTLPNGDIINFDSLVFDSKINTLITSNLAIIVKKDLAHSEINTISAQINEILIAGINFEAIENLHDIELDSITISNGNIILSNNNSAKSINNTDTITKERNLTSSFHSLNLNSFALNNINILNTNKKGDTIINLNNFNFKVNNIIIDSTSIANNKPNIDYNSIRISSDQLKVYEEKSGTKLSLNKFNFSEEAKQISIDNIQIIDHNNKELSSFTTDIAKVNVSGISVQNIINNKPIKINIDITKPNIDLDLVKLANKTAKKKNINLNNFEISEINISKGNIHVFKKNKLEININNLNFNSGIIELTDLKKIHEINSTNYILNTSSTKINLINKNLLFTTNSILVVNNSFVINDISTSFNNFKKPNTTLIVNQLMFEGFNLKEIVNDKKVNLNKFKIDKPKIDGAIDLSKKPNKNNKSQPNKPFDFELNIDDFTIIQGDINVDITLHNNNIKINSGVDINIDNIYLSDGSDTTWLNKLIWKVNLSKPIIHYQDYQISCERIESDKAKEILTLSNISINDNKDQLLKNGIDLRELSIAIVSLSGIKYNTIINKQIPVVNKIAITKPYFNIKIDSRNKQQTKMHGQLNKKALPFDIEDIEINNLSFTIEKEDSISVSNTTLSNLSFKYNMSERNDLIDGIDYFTATDFIFSDSIKNSFTSISNINYNNKDKKIDISDIEGGSIKKIDKDNYLQYTSSGFNIIDIDITQTFPHNISIGEIGIKDFDLNIKDYKKSAPHNKTKKKIELPKLINSLIINEISGKNIDVFHTSITDTSAEALTLNKLGFLINSINIDTNTFKNNDYKFIEEVSVNLRDNKIISKDSLYYTSVNSINYNFHKSELTIDTLLMKPRFEPAEFFKKAVYQTGKMDITTSKIVCSNIRFEKLISLGSIHMGSVDVYGLEMYIFRNKKYKMNPTMYKKMPQEALLSMPRTLTIDSLKTHDSYIQYKQLSMKSVEPGAIFLNKVNLSAFNISNNLKVIDNTSAMVINFNAMLIGESAINLKLTLPILSPAYDFWVSGNVEKIDFTKLNSMTQNLVGVTLKKGTGELDIPLISGNRENSQGKITFKYKKLKVELYDRDKAQNATGLGGSMAKLLLNDILIKSNNPSWFGKTRVGEVYFKRNTQKSIVYYTWKSILSGIMSTMGYNNKEQRQEKRTLKRKNR